MCESQIRTSFQVKCGCKTCKYFVRLSTSWETAFHAGSIMLEDFRKQMEVPETYRYADIKRYAIVKVALQLGRS